MEQNLPFNVDALLVFSKVVECRSLSRAAALLGMPKSTVSRKISKLEADLGIKLLRKNTHQLSVTDLGEQVYQHSLKIFTEANDIRALVEGSKQEPQGALRVAMPVFVGIDYAANVSTLFLQRFPKSRLEIRLVDSMAHPVKDGFDLVLGVGPLQDSSLIARKVFTLDCFLCASPVYLESLAEPVTAPSQVNKLPLIDTDFYGSSNKLVLDNGRKQLEFSPLVRARANSFQICKQYVLQGLGVGILPQQMIVASDELVPLLPEWQAAKVDMYMLYPFQLSFSSLISAFYDTALEVMGRNSRPSA
ncbi:LysR family transcriptional regulator [Pseudomaricurvus sp. HS19]|uniref:LysR family transcriptional regulator n=1 Tax=Pseudomaricurvus sp. HS19 TaxID=2692626 RepID=UPI00136ADBC3|nr:LysR family transcriptional regulator [Pseudomaricurvus sp. HS19]MYM63930.1 LysR family transcriptional regulator [Pseudomaricurvus sp. HS19]